MDKYYPLLYFGPSGFYRELLHKPHAKFVVNEKYSKQSWRNRCAIYGANGPIQLSIPIVRNSGKKIWINDAKIDYATPWQQIHWRSIKSAYGKTPFFEFFADKIEVLYQDKTENLAEFLAQTNSIVYDILGKTMPQLETIGIDLEIQKILDLKANKNKIYEDESYYQAFSDRHGFIPNLSVLDWFFHCGKML